MEREIRVSERKVIPLKYTTVYIYICFNLRRCDNRICTINLFVELYFLPLSGMGFASIIFKTFKNIVS